MPIGFNFGFFVENKAIVRLTFIGAIIVWLIMVFSDITVLFSDLKGLEPDLPTWLPRAMLDLFVISIFYYYKYKIEYDDTLNFTDLLWRVFAVGLVVTISSLSIKLMLVLLGSTALTGNVIFNEIIYLINLALFLIFLVAAFTAWKRLIVYHKSKWLIRFWRVFELTLLFVLIYDTLGIELTEWMMTVMIVDVGVFALVLSANMKWVAYLNFKQKWISLLLLLLSFFYLGYFFYTVTTQSGIIGAQSNAFLDFRSHIFNILLFAFIILYSSFSFLVILFNLPTSSAFEQKLEEVVNFQRISQSVQTEQNEESVYQILLESSVNSSFADAGWLEIYSEPDHAFYTNQITEKDALYIRDNLNKNQVKGAIDQSSDKTRNLSKHLAKIKGVKFRSILSSPLLIKGELAGSLTLLKELPDGFNKEMSRIVSTFVNQAGISIENFRLLAEAFQNERYKEELKIAKMVQKSLLPEKLEGDNSFQISAYSQSADEVGGDYYDAIRLSDHEVALIIADVSGKGTSAAFHMSQMKGIFHSLAQTEHSPSGFMLRANVALTNCLERGSFISAIYFVINTEKKMIRYARAGHCPVLYYCASKNMAEYLKDKGSALGMIRNSSYSNFIDNQEFAYQEGDMLVLYTDGITEAKNGKGQEFGYDRLADIVNQVNGHTPHEMQQIIIDTLHEYSGKDKINDDYTTMIIKFT
ncbi:MAG: SpoIIE family protein phosphatase [Flammeovirgaceae bacterium]|nr:SpoIIE family protein phosphatase [Flammeovirgaceae bacterium]